MKTSAHLERVERAAHVAAKDLAAGLAQYWPVRDRTEMSERNLTLHFGAALKSSGYCCFLEAHPSKGRIRIDLLAWHPKERTLVLVEAKRLFSIQRLQEMLLDFKRIKTFTPFSQIKPRRCIGVLLASTWNPRVRRWWMWDGNGPDPWWRATQAWKQSRLDPGDTRWEAIPLGTEDNQGRTDRHHLLYSIFAIS